MFVLLTPIGKDTFLSSDRGLYFNVLGKYSWKVLRTLSTVIEVLTVEVAVGRVPHLYNLPMCISLLILLYLFILILSFPFPYEENFHVRYAHTATGFANRKTMERVAQSKRARIGLLATVD